jgi:protein-tyrosine-phosphatase
MADRPFNVLFLCTGNSARSIMAEALLNIMGKGRFQAYSAGSRPRGEVHPLALELIAENRMPIEGLRSKDWSEFSRPGAPVMDFVFTVCDHAARESCPVWPGHPTTAHWGVADPAAISGTPDEARPGFRAAYMQLERRISMFLALPFETLERLALKKALDEIGHLADTQTAP